MKIVQVEIDPGIVGDIELLKDTFDRLEDDFVRDFVYVDCGEDDQGRFPW